MIRSQLSPTDTINGLIRLTLFHATLLHSPHIIQNTEHRCRLKGGIDNLERKVLTQHSASSAVFITLYSGQYNRGTAI